MQTVIVRMTQEAIQAMNDGMLGTVEDLVYDFLNLPQPEYEVDEKSCWEVYRDFPVITFPGDLDKYFSLSSGHASLCSMGDESEESATACKAKIDELLSIRDPSRAEQMCAKTLSKGYEAVYKLKGKDAVASLARSLEAGVSKELCGTTNKSYLLASRLASTLPGIAPATQDWADSNMLKYPSVTSEIEAAIEKTAALSARLARHQASL